MTILRLVDEMAHYAYIDETNTVTSVIVGPDEGTEPDGVESWEGYFSAKGKGRALQTSYNTSAGVHYTDGEPSEDQTKALRFNYAGIGYVYDEDRDAFIPPKPFESWELDEATCLWQAPIPYPEDGGEYVWDESEGDWVEVVNEAT
jgi:hypothetical protein